MDANIIDPVIVAQGTEVIHLGYDDRVKILFNYSATPEIEIPFTPSEPSHSGVRITPPMSHLCSLIRTQDVVYFVKGVFVIEVCI